MFRRLGAAIRRFMRGRYGTDQLNMVLLVAAVALSLTNSTLTVFLTKYPVYGDVIAPIVSVVIGLLLACMLFRTFSRNIYRRQRENRRMLQLWNRLRDRRNRYFRCPKCKQTVRVPRGRGKLCIRCPKCGEKFIRKT